MTQIKSLFIFRRDFRLNDNLALIDACKKSDQVVPIFIFDPFQIKENKKNRYYKSNNAIQFMIESLKDLEKQLKKVGSKLRYFYGEPANVVEKLLKSDGDLSCVFFNADFSEYSLKRDKKIVQVCKKYEVPCVVRNDDLTLLPPEEMLKSDGEEYTVFSAFYKNAIKKKVPKPERANTKSLLSSRSRVSGEYKKDPSHFYQQNDDLLVKGGRNEAKKILAQAKKFKHYNKCRDILTYHTTRLSAYMKFGCVSIRECYYTFKSKLANNNELLKQLYWRSFYFCLSRYNERARSYNEFIDPRFDKIKWINSKKEWKALWEDACTGYPIIDAGVRELNTTGFMHNRARLLVGNFSIKILQLNPFDSRWGGQVAFSKQLTDGDYAQNCGNWSWVATDKVDLSGLRFNKGLGGRIFNPVDFKKWDPDCEYVKKWIPELKNVPAKHIHNWPLWCKKYPKIGYPGPIVDYDSRKEMWKKKTSKL